MCKLTLSMACFGRPKRTIRAIESILSQSMNGWEAYIVGDGCPYFEHFIKSRECWDYTVQARRDGNVIYFETQPHKGDSSYIHNYNKQYAKGEFFLFLDNDDLILPNHFENYTKGLDGVDIGYFDTYIEPIRKKREASLLFGQIGHSEISCRTEFIKHIQHIPGYGHDWDFVQKAVKAGAVTLKPFNRPLTYIVKSLPGNPEKFED